jgi:hypothetical protein
MDKIAKSVLKNAYRLYVVLCSSEPIATFVLWTLAPQSIFITIAALGTLLTSILFGAPVTAIMEFAGSSLRSVWDFWFACAYLLVIGRLHAQVAARKLVVLHLLGVPFKGATAPTIPTSLIHGVSQTAENTALICLAGGLHIYAAYVAFSTWVYAFSVIYEDKIMDELKASTWWMPVVPALM